MNDIRNILSPNEYFLMYDELVATLGERHLTYVMNEWVINNRKFLDDKFKTDKNVKELPKDKWISFVFVIALCNDRMLRDEIEELTESFKYEGR
jgi:hypothetical protein